MDNKLKEYVFYKTKGGHDIVIASSPSAACSKLCSILDYRHEFNGQWILSDDILFNQDHLPMAKQRPIQEGYFDMKSLFKKKGF